ncbi:hypothetical protein K7X08_033376 [Anisodus acutangulus]|uniref:Bulb-type lectin domain-containing protein n=1 Tax=Anisodus acutangulus TaxID=402998 RepID=A0A9Q1M1I1_9SOLA|nr:hypothetical protein K7X08_033376 [Anisodus acutangulus]
MSSSPDFLLYLSCLCVASLSANSSDTISSREPVRDSETEVSSGKSFKLGFFRPGKPASRYVGIMFNLPSPTPTVVWVANRDKPLHDSSGIVTISEYGTLVIMNGQEIVWSSSVSNSLRNTTAQLLDPGNLVLKDSSNGRVLWESFRDPTDSLLQYMKIGIDKSTNTTALMKSWRSPSVGNFSAGIQPQPILQAFIWKNSVPYCRGVPWNKLIFIGMPGMQSWYRSGVNLVADNNGTIYQTFSNADQSSILYFFLNSTGSFQTRTWDPSKKDWEVKWANPRTECDFYAKCGPFGSCNPKISPMCSCIQGFKPKNERE